MDDDDPPFLSASRARRRVEDALDWTVSSLADQVREVEGGWIARNRELSEVHGLNQLRVRGEVEPAEVIAIAERHLADLPYRHIEVRNEATAMGLERALISPTSGWRLEREVFMVLGDLPTSRESRDRIGQGRATVDDPIVQLRADEMVALMRRWLAEEEFDMVPGALDQLSEYNRREGDLWAEDVLGVREAGRPVALTKSRVHEGIGWVEDVYTVPEARRRGYARQLVTRAVELAYEAGNELTFIIADDNDWPKHLYAEIGFQPIGCTWTFHRDFGR